MLPSKNHFKEPAYRSPCNKGFIILRSVLKRPLQPELTYVPQLSQCGLLLYQEVNNDNDTCIFYLHHDYETLTISLFKCFLKNKKIGKGC